MPVEWIRDDAVYFMMNRFGAQRPYTPPEAVLDIFTREFEGAYQACLARALDGGEAVLRNGGAALEAFTAAVCAIEGEPLFNAGRGAVFTDNVKQEMDAAVMEGTMRRAGIVAGIFGPRNPIRVPRAVMEHTDHIMLIGENAPRIARDAGLPLEDAAYLFTQTR